MLYGEGGGGKSSLPIAIATHLKADLFYINVDGKNAMDCYGMKTQIDRKCGSKVINVVVIEDVDLVCDLNRESTYSASSIKEERLSNLFNILDGPASSDNTIYIMTTNYIDKLDSALIRPGRVDLKIEMVPYFRICKRRWIRSKDKNYRLYYNARRR